MERMIPAVVTHFAPYLSDSLSSANPDLHQYVLRPSEPNEETAHQPAKGEMKKAGAAAPMNTLEFSKRQETESNRNKSQELTVLLQEH